MRIFPFIVSGPHCPSCGSRTDRVRTPAFLRPVRWLLPSVRRRRCVNPRCGWRGFAFSPPERLHAPRALQPEEHASVAVS